MRAAKKREYIFSASFIRIPRRAGPTAVPDKVVEGSLPASRFRLSRHCRLVPCRAGRSYPGLWYWVVSKRRLDFGSYEFSGCRDELRVQLEHSPRLPLLAVGLLCRLAGDMERHILLRSMDGSTLSPMEIVSCTSSVLARAGRDVIVRFEPAGCLLHAPSRKIKLLEEGAGPLRQRRSHCRL